MAVTSDLPNKVRWTWNRFKYVVATEGTRVALERAVGLSGLTVPHVEPEETLVGPPWAQLSVASAARWPVSLSVLGPAEPGPIAAQILGMAAELRIPVRTAGPITRDLGAVELASALIVVGLDNWPEPALLAEADRLRQMIILLVGADDVGRPALAHALGRSQAVVVDSDTVAQALRARHPSAEVRVIARDARAEELNELMLGLGPEVPR